MPLRNLTPVEWMIGIAIAAILVAVALAADL
jgi:Tfp pilus assembly protein PilE